MAAGDRGESTSPSVSSAARGPKYEDTDFGILAILLEGRGWRNHGEGQAVERSVVGMRRRRDEEHEARRWRRPNVMSISRYVSEV